MDNKTSKSPTSFRQLAKTLSETIGEHHIPLVDGADHPASFIAADAVHYQLIKKLFHLIYKANRCYHLNAPVRFLPTFDALGQIHVQLVSSKNTDIEQINLVNEIGAVCADYFRSKDSYPTVEQFVESSAGVGLDRSTATTTG